jgi:hypothetical protein
LHSQLEMGKGLLPIWSISAHAMALAAPWYFVGSLHQPIPVRCNGSVFAREMHSTTKFAMTILSTCACVCVFTALAAFYL